MIALIRQVIKLEDGTEIAPNNNARILAMDWQIASDESFKNIVLRSENDANNLSSKIFTDILDPNTKWYARARALIRDSGWTVWGNLDVMSYEQVKDVYQSTIIPSRVATPQITTSSIATNHDAILFTIFATGFSVIGNATHAATSWFIEDIDANVVWSSLEDTINLNQIEFRSVLLSNNTVYRIRAMFHSSSGDVSSIASYTILVGGSNVMELITYVDDVDYTTPTEIEALCVDMDVTVSSVDWQIISLTNNYAEIIFSQTTTGTTYGKLTIPADILKDDTNYILKLKPNVEGSSWKYILFKTMNKLSYATTLTVTPTDVTLAKNGTQVIAITTAAKDYTYHIDSPTVFGYDKATKTITGLAEGNGYLTITAQEVDKNPTAINVKVTVTV